MDRFSICLVQPANYVHSLALWEVCQLLAGSIESLGGRFGIQVNTVDPEAVNIVVGYHLLGPKVKDHFAGRRVIVYQLEQLSDREGWFTPERETLLRSAWAVWDYSPENVDFLRARGIERVGLLPIGYHRCLEKIRHRDDAEKDIDVLFYGAVNDRRAAVIRQIQSRLRTECLFGVYGADRDAYIARSRIVLNVHFYQAQILEQVRLAYLLNNRCFVISEEAAANPYDGGVVFGPLAELPELCRQYAACPEERRKIAEQGYRTLQQQPMVDHLRRALAELELL